MGRKNWLFCTSQAGARANALFLSLIETAKANRLVPSEYICMLLEKIPQLGQFPDEAQLEAYLPWNQK